MRTDADFKALLNSIDDPVIILDRAGNIRDLNASAVRLLPIEAHNRGDLCKLINFPQPKEFRQFLRRCSGRTAPMLGALTFAGADSRFECWGSRLSSGGGEPEVMLRLSPIDQGGFSVLAAKVRELNAEIRVRRLSQAQLKEALSYNQVLLRELHHRAKNNIQVMIGLFSTAKRESRSADLTNFLDGAIQRLLALSAAQELMHQSSNMHLLSANEFGRAIVKAATQGLGNLVKASSSAHDGSFIPSEAAQPLALIINELITNAGKHATQDGPVNIHVDISEKAGEIVLVVQDDGPGFPDEIKAIASEGTNQRRSSGMSLVRGLCRQIGASLVVENAHGARITVKFPRHEAKGLHH